MRSLIICVVALSAAGTLAHHCGDSLIHQLYKELNCAPVFEKDSHCPVRYDCQTFNQRNLKQCYYDGVGHNTSSKLDFPGKCVAECRCIQDENSAPTFHCANVECPELFGPPIKPGCRRVYKSLRDCCSSDTDCKVPDDDALKCEVDGRVYREGEKFYPEGTCKTCICKQGYKGVNVEPYCEQVKCESLLHSGRYINDKCVPVYFGKNGCCPIEWKCPNEGDFKVIKTESRKNGDSAKCVFGDLELEAEEKLDVGDSQVVCTCQTPPLLTCIKTYGK